MKSNETKLPPWALHWPEVELPHSPPSFEHDRRINIQSILFVRNFDPYSSNNEVIGKYVVPKSCLSCSLDGERFCDRTMPSCQVCNTHGRECVRPDQDYEDLPLAPTLITASLLDEKVKTPRREKSSKRQKQELANGR
jgi:hypothetical protein